jgi:hypothetical protein
MTKAYKEGRLTDRGRKIKRALKHALEDPSIRTVSEVARFVDWYLDLTEEKAKAKSPVVAHHPSEAEPPV